MSAIKFDGDKPRMELLSRVALEGCARVLTFGARKYTVDGESGDNNWRKGFKWTRLIGSSLRHLLAIADGEDIDPESGLPHVDHLMCNAMFLSEHQKRNLGSDDRWKPNSTTNCSPVNPSVKSGSEEPTMPAPESVFAVRKRNY